MYKYGVIEITQEHVSGERGYVTTHFPQKITKRIIVYSKLGQI
jgi:hypothetical protein